MSENVISKKELLELTGITYGQLYRWKRKQLIPEEWFIKKSSFTGQETYFPKDKILDRVEKILNLKDGKSLDELAETFSPTLSHFEISIEGARQHPLFRNEILDIYADLFADPLSFGDLLGILICQEHLLSGDITQEEGRQLILFLRTHLTQLPEKAICVKYLRKLGLGFFMMHEANSLLLLEQETKVVLELSLPVYTEKLKTVFV